MARINTYSLADYTLSIVANENAPEQIKNIVGDSCTIGGPGNNGEGSFVGSMRVSRRNDLWSTEGDDTGSWVHNKSLNKVGSISVSIRQVSEDVIKFAQICSACESIQGNYAGLHLVITSANGEQGVVSEGIDCFIQKIPDLDLSSAAAMQEWVFTCGQVIFYPQANK